MDPKLFGPTPCPTYFCCCQTIANPFSTQKIEIETKVYFLVAFAIIVTIGGVKMVLEWFIYKDYYPLKEKSPILCILLIISICIQLVFYPLLFISNFFTGTFLEENIRILFRSIQSGLQFTVFIIYLGRCLRISYAHDTHSSRSKSVPFKIFQKEYIVALIICSLTTLRFLLVYLHKADLNGTQLKDFALSIQIQTPVLNNNHYYEQIEFLFRQVLTQFFWHIVMVYCLWLHKNVNSRYSMNNQILLVVICDLISALSTVILLGSNIYKQVNVESDNGLMNKYCNASGGIYPITQIIRAINLILILGISIIKPLTRRKIYHALLPTGRHYGFIKTMRDFLMQQEFLRVFTKYLQHLDEKNEQNTNVILLEFWKKMIVIKLDRKEGEIDKLCSIKNLIQSVQNILFLDHSQLMINLKDSLIGLEESITNSEKITQKYRESINEKVDELQKLSLEKLDKIYRKHYSQTESYFHLKKITDDYKRINLNMIMLNLALIVDTENQFTQ